MSDNRCDNGSTPAAEDGASAAVLEDIRAPTAALTRGIVEAWLSGDSVEHVEGYLVYGRLAGQVAADFLGG